MQEGSDASRYDRTMRPQADGASSIRMKLLAAEINVALCGQRDTVHEEALHIGA